MIPPLLWTLDNSDPFRDLVAAADAILTDTGYVADVIAFGSEAVEVFLRHPKVQLWMDLRRFNVVNVEPEPRAGTAQFLGNLKRPYAAMYSYIEQTEAEDPAGGPPQLVPMLPPDSVLMGCSNAGGRTAYGAITQMESGGNTITVRGEEMVPLILPDANE